MVELEEIGVYTSQRQKMIVQYIATRPIMELCLEAERKPGMRIYRKWWENPDLDIMYISMGKVSAEGG